MGWQTLFMVILFGDLINTLFGLISRVSLGTIFKHGPFFYGDFPNYIFIMDLLLFSQLFLEHPPLVELANLTTED